MPPVIDGVYNLKKEIGKGGMARVFLADVDAKKFNYTQLYGYTQVTGAMSHSEKLTRAKKMVEKLKDKKLDAVTVKNILEVQDIPVPEGQVAVKIANNAEDDLRFRSEWEHLICLSHDNVIKVYGGGVFKKRSYYAMEFVDNLIHPKIILKKFPLKQKIQVIIQASKGLGYLHENGIIHRDVKPANFITTKKSGKFVTKVTDLGMAKSSEQDLGVTTSTSFLGTPYFMSPEQIKSSKDVDERTDIYSLGASLYEMVTGKKPFYDKSSVYEIIEASSKGEIPHSPERLVDNIPEPICDILKCAMQRNREIRYQKMSELTEDLTTFLASEGKNLGESMTFDSVETANIFGDYHFKKYIAKAKQAGKGAPAKKAAAQVALDDEFDGETPSKIHIRKNRRKRLSETHNMELSKKKKNNQFLLIGLGVGALAIAGGAIAMMGGGDDDKNDSGIEIVHSNPQTPPEDEPEDNPSDHENTPEPPDPEPVTPVDVQPSPPTPDTNPDPEPPPPIRPVEPLRPELSNENLGSSMSDLIDDFAEFDDFKVPDVSGIISELKTNEPEPEPDPTPEPDEEPDPDSAFELPFENEKLSGAIDQYDDSYRKSREKLRKVIDAELKRAMQKGNLKEANEINQIKKRYFDD